MMDRMTIAAIFSLAVLIWAAAAAGERATSTKEPEPLRLNLLSFRTDDECRSDLDRGSPRPGAR